MNPKINQPAFDKNNFIFINCLTVCVKEASKFMISFFSYSHALCYFTFDVRAIDKNKEKLS